ncbi:MAG: thioredoxin domain-containing protein [Ferruginibacter sp.]|nr:thioredoxin domain-containing protein [Ferruginibacter sp.]
MLNQYEPIIKATISFLKLLKVKVNNRTVNEALQNHPNWPSMLCITDSLHKWNIPNAVGKIDTSKIDELPTPFIAYTNNNKNNIAIVNSVAETTVQVLQKNYNKPVTYGKEDFVKTWSGVYLIAEPNQLSGETNFTSNKQKYFLNAVVPLVAIFSILIFSFLLMQKNATAIFVSQGNFLLQYFIYLMGTIVTVLLLWYELDKNNPLLQKVCTGIAKGNCNAILTGKAAKVFSWLSWSEVGFFYFTGSLLTILFIPTGITIVAWLNIAALPYTVFSVYYQWRVAKQWCVLCLIVQALLLLAVYNVVLNNYFGIAQLHVLQSTIYVLTLFLLPAIIWYSIKPYLLKLQVEKNTKREFLRLKFNSQIFETLLKKQKQITIPTNGLGIDIGNPNATSEIIKVCNPYCGPCALVHPIIDKLIEQNNNVKAKIIFTTPNDKNNSAYKITSHLLTIATENDEHKTKQALDDWYLPNVKEYKTFATKYKITGELEQQSSKIELMEKWCKGTGITYTPTIFINGYQLPDAYGIEDLEYFLQE